MFFRFSRKDNVLKLDDTWAFLRKIHDNGDLDFEFKYQISQLEAVKLGTLSVKVSVISKTIDRPQIINKSHRGNYDVDGLIKNVLSLSQDSKTIAKQKEENIIASKNSDLTAFINNEIIPQLTAGVPKELIQQFSKTILKLKPVHEMNVKNEINPLYQTLAHNSIQNINLEVSSSVSFDSRQVLHDMILREGIDPTKVVNLTHRSISARNAAGGLLRKTKESENSYENKVRLLHKYIMNHTLEKQSSTSKNLPEQTLVPTLSTEISDLIEVPITLVIKKSLTENINNIDSTHFLVKFELIDSRTNVAVDSIIKTLDVASHIKLFYTPKNPPNVMPVRLSGFQTNLEIIQKDPGANAIQLYKKIVPRTSAVPMVYELIGTYDLLPNHQLNVKVDGTRNSAIIYRVVSIGKQGSMSSEFTNVVIKPQKYKPIKSLSLLTQVVETGVEIEVRSFPPGVVSIQLLCRNLTVRDKSYRNIGMLFIDDATRISDSAVIVDGNVSDGRIYEYIAKLIFKDGTSETVGSSIVEYVPQNPGKVDVTISNVVVNTDDIEPNVTFTMNSKVIDSDIDIVKDLLESQGLLEYFSDDILKERDLLKNLIAHNVQRTNLTTGEREDFGTITTDSFSDKEFRKNNSVSSLKFGYKYRYEISTLLRSAETLFDKFIKEKVDEITKKTYAFKPSKFLHPVTLKDGTLVSDSGLKTRYVKDALSHGKIGTTQIIDVSFDLEQVNVIDFDVTRFDKKHNILSWKVSGDISRIDHFIVMKNIHGVRTVVGKTHNEFTFGNVQYIHELSEQDMGAYTYIVVPVYNDYTIGKEISSNLVIVN